MRRRVDEGRKNETLADRARINTSVEEEPATTAAAEVESSGEE
jgi:hypothetical protein